MYRVFSLGARICNFADAGCDWVFFPPTDDVRRIGSRAHFAFLLHRINTDDSSMSKE